MTLATSIPLALLLFVSYYFFSYILSLPYWELIESFANYTPRPKVIASDIIARGTSRKGQKVPRLLVWHGCGHIPLHGSPHFPGLIEARVAAAVSFFAHSPYFISVSLYVFDIFLSALFRQRWPSPYAAST